MKILIIQTAFIGDVVLATPLIEKLKKTYPEADIDFLVRKGNESLLQHHPLLRNIFTFNKKTQKYRNLIRLIRSIRSESYDYVINTQRFFTTGLITTLSKAKHKIGFKKNPLSFWFNQKIAHEILTENKDHHHEVHRNLALLATLTDTEFVRPKLYPSGKDAEKIPNNPYVCIAPASVWETKKLPLEKWCELITTLPKVYEIILLGGKNDVELCQNIKQKTNGIRKVCVKAGRISLLESVAFIKSAAMTFTNDSAPLHFASAVNAPVSAMFCSTIPAFGFFPLSDKSFVFEANENLSCRPCGLHGKKKCPLNHFKCGNISIENVVKQINL